MALLNEVYNMRYDPMLQKRCTSACTIKAQEILIEVPSTPNHTARLAWANATFRDPVAENEKLMWHFVQNPTLQTKQSPDSISNGIIAPDSDIQFVVNQTIDAVIVDVAAAATAGPR
jgi:hypothetical protein